MALLSHLDLGVRYILPAYPFVCILAGIGLAHVWGWRNGIPEHTNGTINGGARFTAWLSRLGVAALVAWQIYGALRIYPHNLAFFNELVGGPCTGYLYLGDSNVDWHQDLLLLEDYVHTHHISGLRMIYLGTVRLDRYGISEIPLYRGVARQEDLRGWVAIGELEYDNLADDGLLYSIPPTDNVGYSILIYRLPR
jgi:hypothetical protein